MKKDKVMESGMEDYFIQNIFIKDIRGIKDLEIPLSTDERKHLIITGKNGSGKTSTLLEINKIFNTLIESEFENTIDGGKIIYLNPIKEKEKEKINLYFSNNDDIPIEDILDGKFILIYFTTQRKNSPNVPTTITQNSLLKNYPTKPSLNQAFIQYMVNLYTDKMYAKDEEDFESVRATEKWFESFEKSLRVLFDTPSLKLLFKRKELNFKIEYDNKSFGFNQLSDGYSSVLAILTELILRMEAHKVKAYDMQGVVLIDEIETHLHVDLQKKILPFLVSFFPKIQFIVTTHSPFVLSSLSNAVICDLEKRFVTSDLSSYSYDALIESYFDSDKYSSEVKKKIERFEKLSIKEILTDDEKDEYMDFKRYFKNLPTFMADELKVKIQQILLNNFKR